MPGASAASEKVETGFSRKAAPHNNRRIGIDLGGTKIDAIVMDDRDKIVFEKRVDTPKDYAGMVKAVAALVADAGEGTVGMGAPGSADPATGIWRNANYQPANGKRMQKDLEAATGRAVRLENDANCFALSEAKDGAGQGFKIVAFFTIGTGLGGGLVVNGEIIRGAHAEAAEFGHTGLPWMTPEDWPPVPCFCGKSGCTEMYVSGTGLAGDFLRVTGRRMAGPDIIAAARAGDAPCQAAIKRMQTRFARVCANLINIIDPDVFVMGGGMSSLPEFVEDLPARIAPFTFSGHALPKVLRARHGGNSGVRGAARLWD